MGGETPCLGRSSPGKDSRYPLYKRPGGIQCLSERVWNISPPTDFDPQIPMDQRILPNRQHCSTLPEGANATHCQGIRKQASATLCQHRLLSHCADTGYCHTVPTQATVTLCQHKVLSHCLNTGYCHTVPTQATVTLCQHTLVTLCQHRLLSHCANTEETKRSIRNRSKYDVYL
jgi:hypothetical protein